MRRTIFGVLILALGLEAQVNLYISNAEMNRTLGLHAEMSYVENGVVNAYATKFPYRVGPTIDQVTFTWHAAGKYYYTARVDSEDMSVLPVLHIPTHGEVPHQPQEFIVEYRCAGHRSGQFVVSLFFNFSSPHAARSTVVRLKQEKICASRDGRRGISGGIAEELDQGSDGEIQHTFYLIIGAAAIFLLIITILLFSFFRRSKKESTACTPTPPRTSARPISVASRLSLKNRNSSAQQPFLTSTPLRQPPPSTANSLLETSSLPSTSASSDPSSIFFDRPNTVDIRKALISLHVDREPFNILPFLESEGTFGEIRFAIWRQTDDATNGDVDDEEDAPCNDEAVLSKTLKKNATPQQLEKFLQEALAFHNLPHHSNLAQVACAASFGKFDDPSSVNDLPLLCYRHQGFGNLRKFLLNCRDGDKKGALRPQELVSLCLQVSRALSHIHKHKLLHKDVAARNCIISEVGTRLVVQLCDSSLSKDIFPGDYHCLGDNDNRPIKWMAPEAIAQRQLSSAGDVWSFGVLCWEIFSLGSVPYADIDAEDMQDALTRGVRLSQPFNCPDQMFNVTFCCWREKPKERPSADHVNGALEQFSVQLTQFV